MAQFIKLTERHGGNSINVNVEQIVHFHGNHEYGEGWQFTHIVYRGGYIDVRETQEEILQKIGINL